MKSILKFSTLLLLAFVVFSTSCKKDDSDDDSNNNNNNNTTSYFTFAKVGNVSNYITQATIPFIGNVTGSMTQRVIEKVSDNIYKVETVMDLGLSSYGVPATTDTSLWYISNTEFASVEDDGTNFFYYKKGDAVNKTYSFTSADAVTSTRLIMSTSASTVGGTATYSCYKIKETDSGSTNESYYYLNNEAGLVKFTTIVTTSGMTVNIDVTLAQKNF